MRRALVRSGRLPALMRTYPGFRPFEVGEYTDEELTALLNDQDAEQKAIKQAIREQKRAKRRRR